MHGYMSKACNDLVLGNGLNASRQTHGISYPLRNRTVPLLIFFVDETPRVCKINANMSCRPRCSKTPLGKVSNAGTSLTGRGRKSEQERPLSVVHSRHTWAGHLVILEGSPEGWTAITEQGVFINPWKNRPFSSALSCHKAVRYRLKKGRWPGSIGKKPNQITDSGA